MRGIKICLLGGVWGNQDLPPSVDSTSCSRHRSIAGYRPTIVLIAADRRSVHSMRLSHTLDQNPNFCLPTCIRRPRWVGVPSEYCCDVWYGKIRMAWLPDGEKNWRYVYSFWQNACTNVTHTRANRRTDTAWRLMLRLHSIVHQKMVIKQQKLMLKTSV